MSIGNISAPTSSRSSMLCPVLVNNPLKFDFHVLKIMINHSHRIELGNNKPGMGNPDLIIIENKDESITVKKCVSNDHRTVFTRPSPIIEFTVQTNDKYIAYTHMRNNYLQDVLTKTFLQTCIDRKHRDNQDLDLNNLIFKQLYLIRGKSDADIDTKLKTLLNEDLILDADIDNDPDIYLIGDVYKDNDEDTVSGRTSSTFRYSFNYKIPNDSKGYYTYMVFYLDFDERLTKEFEDTYSNDSVFQKLAHNINSKEFSFVDFDYAKINENQGQIFSIFKPLMKFTLTIEDYVPTNSRRASRHSLNSKSRTASSTVPQTPMRKTSSIFNSNGTVKTPIDRTTESSSHKSSNRTISNNSILRNAPNDLENSPLNNMDFKKLKKKRSMLPVKKTSVSKDLSFLRSSSQKNKSPKVNSNSSFSTPETPDSVLSPNISTPTPGMSLNKKPSIENSKHKSASPFSNSIANGVKSTFLNYVKSKNSSPSSPLDTMINQGMDYTPTQPVEETNKADYASRTSISSSAFAPSEVTNTNDKKSFSERLGIHKVRSLRSVKSALSMKSNKTTKSMKSHISTKSLSSMFSSNTGSSMKSTNSNGSRKSFAAKSIAKIKDSFSMSIKQLKQQNNKSVGTNLNDFDFKYGKYGNREHNEDKESLDIPTEKMKDTIIELPNVNTSDSLQFRSRINYLENYLLNVQPILLQFFKNMELYIGFLIDTNNSRKGFIESIVRLKKFLIINNNDEEGDFEDCGDHDSGEQFEFENLNLNFDFANTSPSSDFLTSFLQFHECMSKNFNSKSLNRYLNRLIESLNSEYQYFDRYIEIMQDTLLKGMQEAIIDSGYGKSDSKVKDFINKVNSKIGKLAGNDIVNANGNSDDVLKNDESAGDIFSSFVGSTPTTSTSMSGSTEGQSINTTASSRNSKASLSSILNSADSEKVNSDTISFSHSTTTVGTLYSQEFEADKFTKNFIQNKKEYYDTTKDFYHYGSKYLNSGNRISNAGLNNKSDMAVSAELMNADDEQNDSANYVLNCTAENSDLLNKRVSDNSYRNSSTIIYDEATLDNIEPTSKDLKFLKKRKNFELSRISYYESLNSYKNGSFFIDLQINLLKFLNGIEQLNFRKSYENKQINLNGESNLAEISYHKEISAEVDDDKNDGKDLIQSEKKLQYLSKLAKIDKALKLKNKELVKEARNTSELVAAVNFNILNNGMHYGCKNNLGNVSASRNGVPSETNDNFFILNDDIVHQGLLFAVKPNNKIGKCWVVLTKYGKIEEYDYDKIDNAYVATAPNSNQEKRTVYNADALEFSMYISFGCVKDAIRKFGIEIISIKDQKKIYQCFSEEEKQLWLRLLNETLQSSHSFSDVSVRGGARNHRAEADPEVVGISGDASVEKNKENFKAEPETCFSNDGNNNSDNQKTITLNHNQGTTQRHSENQPETHRNSSMFGKTSKDKINDDITVNNDIAQGFFNAVNNPGSSRPIDYNGYSVNLSYDTAGFDGLDYLNIVRSSHESNYNCCDCGSTSGVEWISISLLVIVCIDCSGIHRSLGSHISKIRSLTLDVSIFTPEIIKLLTSVSNEHANSYWEKKLAVDKSQLINSTSTANERSQFIVDKYKEKKYVPRDDKVNSHLIYGIHSNKVPMILKSLACGGNPNMVVIKGKDKEVECSLLEYALTHYSGTPEKPIFEIAELLLLNGAKCGTEVGDSLNLIDKAKEFWQFKIDRSLGINSSTLVVKSENENNVVNNYSNFDPNNTTSKSFENKVAYNKKGRPSGSNNDASDSQQSQKKIFSSQIPFFSRSAKKKV